MDKLLEIRLMGTLGITYDGEDISDRFQGRSLLLLLYLLLHPPTPMTRQFLAFQLWPDSSEGQALSNLRTQLCRLAKVMPHGDRYIRATRQVIQWLESAPCEVDVRQFLRAASQVGDRRGIDAALGLYHGPLLPLLNETWLEPIRAELVQTCLSLLDRGLEASVLEGDTQGAAGYLHRAIEVDTLNESHYLRLVRHYLEQGNRAHALSVYHACLSTMREKLGTEPGPVMQQLYLSQLQRDSGSSASTDGRPPLLDREREWEQLVRLWQSARTGRSQGIAVLGEMGMGKSRLLEEALGMARREGALAALATCQARGSSLAYEAVSELLRALPRSRLPASALQDVSVILPDLETVHRTSTVTTNDDSSFEQRHRLFSALTRMMEAIQPVVLAIDDVQWCDIESLDWVMYLLVTQPRLRLLVLLGMRSDEPALRGYQGKVLRKLQVQGRLTALHLKPLRLEATALLARHFLGQPLPASRVESLHAKTTGSPLFLVEILRARSGGDPGLEDRLPHSLRTAIEARLSRLGPCALSTLEAASVLGHTFDEPLLVSTSGQPTEQVLDALDELWNRAIFCQADALSYRITHGQIAELVYESLTPPRRLLLHLNAARALDALPPARRGKRLAELARHCEMGGLEAQAFECYLEAGSHAEQVAALHEAYSHYRAAWRLSHGIAEPHRMWHLLTRLDAVRFNLFLSESQEDVVSAMEALAEAHHNEDWMAQASIARLRAMISGEHPEGVHERALSLLERARRMGRPDVAFEASLFVAQGGMFWGSIDASEAQARLEAAAGLADQLPDPAARLRLLCHQVLIDYLERDPEALLPLAQEALSLAEGPRLGRYQTWLLQVRTIQAANLGLEGALELARAGLESCRRTALLSRVASGQWAMSWALMANRRFSEARETLTELLSGGEHFYGPNSFVHFVLAQIRCLLEMGRYSEALRAQALLIDFPLSTCELDAQLEAHLLGAELLIVAGQAAQALQPCHQALTRVQNARLSERRGAFVRLEVAGTKARALESAGDVAGAYETLLQARAEAEPFGLMRFRPQLQAELAHHLLGLGREAEAEAMIVPVLERLARSLEGITRPQKICSTASLVMERRGRPGEAAAWRARGRTYLEETASQLSVEDRAVYLSRRECGLLSEGSSS